MAHLTGPPESGSLHLTNTAMRSSPMVEHQQRNPEQRNPAPLPHAPVTPRCDTQPHQPSPKAPWAVPSSMAALINAASLDSSSSTAIKEARKTPQGETILKPTTSPAPTPQPSEKEAPSEVKEESTSSITKTEDSAERKDTAAPEGHTKKTGAKGSSQLK